MSALRSSMTNFFAMLGQAPTLTGMASRTLKAKYETADSSVGRREVIMRVPKMITLVDFLFRRADDRSCIPTVKRYNASTKSPDLEVGSSTHHDSASNLVCRLKTILQTSHFCIRF